MENEIPLGQRSAAYRAFEMLPAAVSYTMLALVLILPFFSPVLAAWYVLGVLAVMFVRAVRSAIDLLRGYRRLRAAEVIDWNARLERLEGSALDLQPSAVTNAVIVAAYNESYEVIAPTIRSLAASNYELSQLVIFFAYEERGGEGIERTAVRLRSEFGAQFGAFELVRHPRDLPDEIAGKGANISYAGRALERWVAARGLDPATVLVTTLDCDNKPHRDYFACASYHFVLDADRGRASYQPMSLFLNNIWDAPAPTRVIASGNTFWNITSSVRPLTLRNFASHSQPLDALIEMGFWSTRTIVEDGHQYWRSYFHFRGRYRVVAIPIPIYQDAVLADTYGRTLVAQFKQLSRWSYGASDVPYVGVRVFRSGRPAPFWPSLWRFFSLLEGHVTLASISIIIAAGGWLPFLFASRSGRRVDAFVQNLPWLVGTVQQIALIGLIVSIVLAWRMLPERPERYGPVRSLGMLLQWLLFPATIIGYNAVTAICSQGRLLIGAYRENFEVTAKSALPLDGPRFEPALRTGPISLPLLTGSIPLPIAPRTGSIPLPPRAAQVPLTTRTGPIPLPPHGP